MSKENDYGEVVFASSVIMVKVDAKEHKAVKNATVKKEIYHETYY